ncbi:ROK family protein [Nonomuraea glycinis]|uniref:Sugar kinase n=1 Tax=Nonomuraea glycinis TaxID=2047744 RepID=A0A918AEH0_9ACTN|nr:ROK family protein [Nonomuraea glycinis]MCA2179722.1 ROK family protein [Nonomuraea glycinis]GGP16451.1 sugar kinase [Nonomuraea glycinis]
MAGASALNVVVRPEGRPALMAGREVMRLPAAALGVILVDHECMRCVVAVDVGGTTMKGGLITQDGTILYAERRPTPRAEGPAQVIAAISAFVTDLARPRTLDDAQVRPEAVGLAVPGLVTPQRALYSAALGWKDVPAEAFTDVALPVALGHDVRAAGEAELVYGRAAVRAEPPAGHVLFMPIGTGIAGALVLGGSLYGGAAGWAGQIGHVPVWPDGLPCSCGQRGCLAAYASASAIASRCGETSAADVARRVRAGDPRAVTVWGEAAEALALALATYTLLLDPALIVIGGGLAQAGDLLLDPLRERLGDRLTFRPAPMVRVSGLGPDAGLLGAGLLGFRALPRL